ncbi:DUF1769-domain-containing protein [Westerdykella ornata]|uniref:DUF1769-domain-containing protein n=1 Tax=Westerdykella ornata TaxID=318751 RepID=A0A6A6JIL0_WESOR|nr:DUF1769-domain-containing protein [Westerdykella ornata]KAF2275778.1 DUF1769-domain-containing protein [Westerdykella ornata]
MARHEQYMLRVTAGHTYDTSKHQDVHVNTEKPITIFSDHIEAKLHVRVKDYRGLPPGSPSTSPYFSTPQHPYDRYSISFSFKPKRSIAGHHLVFGNDFAHPIRDRLPPLFDKAFSIVKWWIDPGLDGEVYGDEPYLYGPLLSSINVLRIGSKNQVTLENKVEDREEEEVIAYEEGAEGDGIPVREELGIPSLASQRQKHFLREENRQNFEFEEGREYKCDFFNPYLDFNEFSLKLGYGLPAISIVNYWDGQPLRPHTLRYVLKDRSTNTELLVVIFQLVPTEEAKEQGAQSPEEMFDSVHGGKEKADADGTDDLD